MKNERSGAVAKFILDNPGLPVSGLSRSTEVAHTLAQYDPALVSVSSKSSGVNLTRDTLFFACSCSPWLTTVIERYPEIFLSTLKTCASELPKRSDFDERLQATIAGSAGDSRLFMQRLREFRHVMLGLIAVHDLAGISPIDKVLQALSDLADSCLQRALSFAEEVCGEKFGVARDENGNALSLVVAGMGKLGGQELNFSSDIDLVFLYAANGTTDGGRKIDNEAYFRRVGQQLIKYLGEVTADGFVYRVDMRLRPFGNSGPLVVSLDLMENYLFTQGRDWERYAWIKSRVICGRVEDTSTLEEMLRPFIYRRYLDYAVFESLRDLKRQISAKVVVAGSQQDIKLGHGGIREIEFIAQSFQLVRGGKEPKLQGRCLREVMLALAESNHLTGKDAAKLLKAYDFLRRTENRLQMVDDRQTHLVPLDEQARLRLANSLCYSCFESFASDLKGHCEFVQSIFAHVFSTPATESADTAGQHEASMTGARSDSAMGVESEAFGDVWMQVLGGEPGIDEVSRNLDDEGINNADETARLLIEFGRGDRYLRYANRSRELIDKLIPKVLEEIRQTKRSHPDTLLRVLSLLNAVAGRSGYLQLLCDSEKTLKNLIRLFAQSPWLAEFVASHPMVLDDLLDIEQTHRVASVEQNVVSLDTELRYHRDPDLGELMDLVRQFQHSEIVRIAARDVIGDLSVMRVSDGLSWLAESVLQVATRLVGNEMQVHHGVPQCEVNGEVVTPDLAIVAYGKLGGVELGYGSDLDIVFVHESRGSGQVSNGDKPLENQVYFSRMAQKLVHFLATLTSAGVLYEIDTRLRPNGRSGVLVIGIDAFADYQRREAWTWEHQALVRARVVVGSERLRQQFEQIRNDTLQSRAPDEGKARDKLRNEVAGMRERMRQELNKDSKDWFDIKQGHGGIADIEFMVQYLILGNSFDCPPLLLYTDNVRQLEALQQHGYLGAAEADSLTQAYLYLRGRYHRRAMLLEDGIISCDDECSQHRNSVISCWQNIMNG